MRIVSRLIDITALYWRDLKIVSFADRKLTEHNNKTTENMIFFIRNTRMNIGLAKRLEGSIASRDDLRGDFFTLEINGRFYFSLPVIPAEAGTQ